MVPNPFSASMSTENLTDDTSEAHVEPRLEITVSSGAASSLFPRATGSHSRVLEARCEADGYRFHHGVPRRELEVREDDDRGRNDALWCVEVMARGSISHQSQTGIRAITQTYRERHEYVEYDMKTWVSEALQDETDNLTHRQASINLATAVMTLELTFTMVRTAPDSTIMRITPLYVLSLPAPKARCPLIKASR